jgi:hypothetical protein
MFYGRRLGSMVLCATGTDIGYPLLGANKGVIHSRISYSMSAVIGGVKDGYPIGRTVLVSIIQLYPLRRNYTVSRPSPTGDMHVACALLAKFRLGTFVV